jgi:hypothetical protein
MNPVRIKFISSVASGLLATSVSCCLSMKASTALHHVSHWVVPTSAIPKVSWPSTAVLHSLPKPRFYE